MEAVGLTDVWRLLIDDAAPGAWNMAVDRAVLEAVSQAAAPPSLRLYSWSPPAVSLGRFQRASAVDLEAAAALGFEVVHRPTGGRAVLHDDELTYSVVASADDGVPKGTSASYRYLCSALVRAYRLLGVEASLTPGNSGDLSSSACYLQSTPADLSLGAAKLSGSAQVWRRQTVLQHGSFVISRDSAAEARLFRMSEAQAEALAGKTATLEQALGRRPGPEELRDSLVEAFSEALGVELREGCLTEREKARASELAAESLG